MKDWDNQALKGTWEVFRPLFYISTIALLAFLFALAIDAVESACAFARSLITTVGWGCAEFWINRYQTFVTGILALVGALATVWAINRQIKQANDLADAARMREETAARAVLPLALSELCAYATECIKLLAPHVSAPPVTALTVLSASIPEVSQDVLGTLRDCVRYGAGRVNRQISTVLASLQVQRARLKDTFASAAARHGGGISQHEAISRMLEAAELYVKCEDLFEYGRELADLRVKPIRKDITKALLIAGIVDVDEPELLDMIARRYPI